MSRRFEKLVNLLRELFQLDQPDLDFGIYRILHARGAEVTQFLEKDLLPQVRAAFEQYRPADKAEIQKQLNKLVASIVEAGMEPDQSPKVADLRARLANESVDLDALEAEVYDHLYGFFRRYYSEGDFLSKRVYKPGVYAIPYEGEEVKLHWANADQYYIKTSEYFRDYAFRLRPDDHANPMRVHFRLVDAAEGEHGNVKEASGKERRFKLAAESPVSIEDGELVVRFTYEPDPRKQKELNAEAEETILGTSEDELAEWVQALEERHVRADGEKSDSTRLRVHLDRYTARNTFDYFIHKDLSGFLRRELDFYIKNEVMHLDDVESESAPKVEQYLSKIKVIRRIAGKIIDFLAQLEEFQRKLWLKKKFVTESQYCITLDRIPVELYPDICANVAQHQEWEDLFSISLGELLTPELGVVAPEVTPKVLAQHPTLILDTKHFPAGFKEKLLDAIGELDGSLESVVIHSDNFQALSFLQARLRQHLRCIYIDPPYNTSASAIPYKNSYRHSSWCTLLRDRVELARRLMREDGALFVSIDKTERTVLEHALDEVFGGENHIEELIWTQATANSQLPTYATNHEYVEVYARDRGAVEKDPRMFREPKPGFAEVMALVARVQPQYPPAEAIEAEIRKLYDDHVREFREEWESRGGEWDSEAKRQDSWRGIYPYNRAEYRDANGRFIADSDAASVHASIWVWREMPTGAPAGKQSPTTKVPDHPNFRYYRPRHPLTKQLCPHPKTGWKFPHRPDSNNPDRRSFTELDADHRIVWGEDENKIPQSKGFLHEVETNISTSVFYEYNDGEAELSRLFGAAALFLSPKSSRFVRKFLSQTTDNTDWFMDFFGGSGSSGHAVVAQNRIDGGSRKQVIVEVEKYFDTLLIPRLKKAIFASEWKDGKPASQDGRSSAFKYLRLESYEDALGNLELRRSEAQQSLLAATEAQGPDKLREQYVLRYMLDVESRGSQSLLNVRDFINPTAYKLRVKRPGSDESREVDVDLLETFNWLIGLTVQHIAAPRTFSAKFVRDGEKRLRLDGRLKQDSNGPWWFRTVTGTTPDGRKALVVWRKRPGADALEGVEEDNLVLDEWFTRQGYSARDSEFDLIYVNGGNNLENLKTAEDTWKVRLIEEDFHRLMFDTEGA